jgi:hypothetical protein
MLPTVVWATSYQQMPKGNGMHSMAAQGQVLEAL